MESNVHLLAKLVPKLSVTHGNEGVTSGEIFAAYILKMFWEGDKKQEDNEVGSSYVLLLVFSSHIL